MNIPRLFNKNRLNDVFTPGGQPKITYVDRAHLGLEKEVRKALSLPSTIVSLTGATKSGKTVLCRNVLIDRQYVWIDGGQIREIKDLWQKVCAEFRMASEVTEKTLSSNQAGAGAGGEASIGLPGNQLKFSVTINGSQVKTTEESRKFVPDGPAEAINTMVENQIYLVIDDFHYLPDDTRGQLVRDIKGAVFRDLKVVLLSTPHRAFEAIKAEPEITGRFKHVTVPIWAKSDLELIATTGFDAMNVSLSSKSITSMTEESEGSPLLMQRFCWNACFDSGVETELALKKNISGSVNLEAIYDEVAEDAGLPIYEKLAKGPQTRTDRIPRPLNGGSSADIYQCILLAVAVTGPKERLSYDQIRSSLSSILSDKLPQKIEVSNALNHLTAIDKKENEGQRAIDWDGDNLNLYITDPFFRFYLRWRLAKRYLAKGQLEN